MMRKTLACDVRSASNTMRSPALRTRHPMTVVTDRTVTYYLTESAHVAADGKYNLLNFLITVMKKFANNIVYNI